MAPRLGSAGLVLAAAIPFCTADVPTIVSGSVRVQLLSPTVVRVEQRGPHGFDDRKTFVVRNRTWPGVRFTSGVEHGAMMCKTAGYTVRVKLNAESLQDVTILSPAGKKLAQFGAKLPDDALLPAPGDHAKSYELVDRPRIVPAPWGATPAPVRNLANDGWDLGNDAPDVYVMVPGNRGFAQIRSDVLQLTGPTPMLPESFLGFIDSRYHPYTQKEALDSIDAYRTRHIPLDVFVVDTDWRVNGSHGYTVDTDDFPDMPGFIRDAHAKGVKLMFNDHPEPQSDGALDEKELTYRWNGLTSLMKLGLDAWWYDRNWSVSVKSPSPSLRHEVWGQEVYHDITQQFRPGQRPAIMSNVDGIDNGFRHYAPQPASHRFPLWWTGDTRSEWRFLRFGVENAVDYGAFGLLPYMSEDLGGHVGQPSPELYVRYLQFGAFSPIMRVHCTRGQDRHPWAFGPEAEKIVTDFIRMRYRLMPTLYSASRGAFETGVPLLRRCDLEWPTFPEAASNHQYLFGDDVLVAPVLAGIDGDSEPVPATLLHTPDGKPGLAAEFFPNRDLQGTPTSTRVDPQVQYDWSATRNKLGLPKGGFSERWTGKIGPMPRTQNYRFAVTSDDGARLFIDGRNIVDAWRDMPETTNVGEIRLEAGKSYDIRLEYYDAGGEAVCRLGWFGSREKPTEPSTNVWIPPGTWIGAWTGQVLTGPRQFTVRSPLWHMPLFIRRGSILFLADQVEKVADIPESSVIADIYPPAAGASVKRTLYQDDGLSNGYLSGEYAKTQVACTRSATGLRVDVAPREGPFGKPDRAVRLRIHLSPVERVSAVRVNGKLVESTTSDEPYAPGVTPFQTEGGGGRICTVQIPNAPSGQQLKVEFVVGGFRG